MIEVFRPNFCMTIPKLVLGFIRGVIATPIVEIDAHLEGAFRRHVILLFQSCDIVDIHGKSPVRLLDWDGSSRKTELPVQKREREITGVRFDGEAGIKRKKRIADHPAFVDVKSGIALFAELVLDDRTGMNVR